METNSESDETVYSTSSIVEQKAAIQKIVQKYDALRRLSDCQDQDDCESQEDCELTEKDIVQVEVFFRSHKTYVYVCQCLANLYFCNADGGEKRTEWQLARTGIPVLLLDKGETRARTKRMVQIVLAEKGSGFVLWRDIIDNLSNYRSEDTTFHTMYLSTDHRKMAGFSFDNLPAAVEFYDQVDQLVSDPLNISLSMPKKKNAKKKQERIKLPKKCDISQPCCFQHITNVDLGDKEKLYTMATLVPSNLEQSAL